MSLASCGIERRDAEMQRQEKIQTQVQMLSWRKGSALCLLSIKAKPLR